MSRIRKKKRKEKEYNPDQDYYLKQSQGGCYKREFTTKKKALTNKDAQMAEDSSLTLFTYKCPNCHKWHVTKKPRR
jgi:hypothetical protein